MIDAIGGYFGMEPAGVGVFPHQKGVLLNMGRNAFQYILQSISSIRKLYIPYYTCPVVWRHLFFSGELYYYQIDQNLELKDNIELKDGEYIVVNNYFGIKDAYIEQLYAKYGEHLIVDNAQAFFAPIYPDMKSFYSARKFFGVPDGGIAYVSRDSITPIVKEQDDSSDRLEHLHIRNMFGAEKGFATFQKNESKLDAQPIKWMSEYTHDALEKIDYATAVERRQENYRMLNDALGERNALTLPDISSFACPMVYPFMVRHADELRNELGKNRIYTATYWRYVVDHAGSLSVEKDLAQNILPLPIDQRYGEEDMKRIIDLIKMIRFC